MAFLWQKAFLYGSIGGIIKSDKRWKGLKKITCILGIFLCLFFVSCTSVSENMGVSQTVLPVKTPEPTPDVSNEVNEPTVVFSTFDVNEKYYNDLGDFVELDLKLPILTGTYEGIPVINEFFADKEMFFYDELPIDLLQGLEAASEQRIEGKSDNFYRQAYYRLEAQLGNLFSVSAALDGGAGGVSWGGIEGDTFDLNTGEKLSLSDIFEVGEDGYMNYIYDFVSEKISDEIHRNQQNGHGSPYSFDDAYSGNGYESIRNFDPHDFYLTEASLVIFYQKYALTVGAAGPQAFEIPYKSISDMLTREIPS